MTKMKKMTQMANMTKRLNINKDKFYKSCNKGLILGLVNTLLEFFFKV